MNKPPVNVAFDIFLRNSGGTEVHVGEFTAQAGKGRAAGARFHESKLYGLSGDRLDVVLRPSTAAARRTTGLQEIWGGELVLRDVPVIWLAPPAKTAAGAPATQPAR